MDPYRIPQQAPATGTTGQGTPGPLAPDLWRGLGLTLGLGLGGLLLLMLAGAVVGPLVPLGAGLLLALYLARPAVDRAATQRLGLYGPAFLWISLAPLAEVVAWWSRYVLDAYPHRALLDCTAQSSARLLVIPLTVMNCILGAGLVGAVLGRLLAGPGLLRARALAAMGALALGCCAVVFVAGSVRWARHLDLDHYGLVQAGAAAEQGAQLQARQVGLGACVLPPRRLAPPLHWLGCGGVGLLGGLWLWGGRRRLQRLLARRAAWREAVHEGGQIVFADGTPPCHAPVGGLPAGPVVVIPVSPLRQRQATYRDAGALGPAAFEPGLSREVADRLEAELCARLGAALFLCCLGCAPLIAAGTAGILWPF